MAQQVPFMTFENRLQASRELFLNNVPTIGDHTWHHHNGEALIKYRDLCVRGFNVQGSLDPTDHSLDEVFRVVGRIGWTYTLMNVNPFCPRVVREFLSNKPFHAEGALIRGYLFRFIPSVINQLMMTPSVDHSFSWRRVHLHQAISYLTGGQCSGWTDFNLNFLIHPFQTLYRVCELNWIPGPASDPVIKDRLRLLFAVAKRKKIDFGYLVYDQVIEMVRRNDWDTNLIFPNLIYQVLILQHEIPSLPGDEKAIGRGIPIHRLAGQKKRKKGAYDAILVYQEQMVVISFSL